MSEGTVGRWLAAEGDQIRPGAALLEIITDKAAFELPAEVEGVLRKIFAPEKSLVPGGYVLAAVGVPEEDLADVDGENAALLSRAASELSEPSRPQEGAEGPSAPASPPSPPPPGGGRGTAVRATPAARRLARERGVDLAALARSIGPGRTIREEDVRSHPKGERS